MDLRSRDSLEVFKTFCSSILEHEESLNYDLEKSRRLRNGLSALESVSYGPLSPSSASSSGSLCPDSGSDENQRGLTADDVEGISTDNSRKRNNSGWIIDINEDEEYSSDDESWNMVTCFCEKPFAGRPMIECAACKTWLHLSCAKVRKSEIPDLFVCSRCRSENPGFFDTRTFRIDGAKKKLGSRGHRSKSKRKK